MAFIYDLTDTWNAGGTTFNAIKMNVTDTASAAGSKLVTLQVVGSERFGVDKAGIGTFGSVVRAAGGSTSAPAFSFTSDTNSGMWSPSSDTIAFSTAGSERLRMTSGNLGVGTSSPDRTLHVASTSSLNTRLERVGSAGGAGIEFENTVGAFAVFGTPTGASTGAFVPTGSGVDLGSPSNQWGNAYFAGNVGINEATPDYRLDVNGPIGFTPGSSVTPVDNGDVVFELTSNTTLSIKARGSDGVVRVGTILLT